MINLKNFSCKVPHTYSLPVHAIDLVKEYQYSLRFKEMCLYIVETSCHPQFLPKKRVWTDALNYIVINNPLFSINAKEKFIKITLNILLVIPEKLEPVVLHTYYNSLLSSHQARR